MATNIAIDIGTKKTVLYSGSRVVLEQPSVVTVTADTREPVYFGEKAYQTLGRTPDSLTCVFPVRRSRSVCSSRFSDVMTVYESGRVTLTSPFCRVEALAEEISSHNAKSTQAARRKPLRRTGCILHMDSATNRAPFTLINTFIIQEAG